VTYAFPLGRSGGKSATEKEGDVEDADSMDVQAREQASEQEGDESRLFNFLTIATIEAHNFLLPASIRWRQSL